MSGKSLSNLWLNLPKDERPSIEVDIEKYQAYLDGSDATEEEKEAFLRWLWGCIIGLVDMGYGVHPLQSAAHKDPDNGSGQDSSKFKATPSAIAAPTTSPNNKNTA